MFTGLQQLPELTEPGANQARSTQWAQKHYKDLLQRFSYSVNKIGDAVETTDDLDEKILDYVKILEGKWTTKAAEVNMKILEDAKSVVRVLDKRRDKLSLLHTQNTTIKIALGRLHEATNRHRQQASSDGAQ